MNNINLDDIVEIIKEVSKNEILPRFKHLTAEDIEQKTSSHDLVTTADKMSEKELNRRLTSYLPGSTVVGEEETYLNPKVYDRLKEKGYVWIIDPVDGTNNFSKGFDDFGVIVSLVKDSKTVAGFIYAPVRDEMIFGELGSGAFKNGQRLSVSNTENISDILAITGAKCPVLKENVKEVYWTHSAAIAYQHLIEGKANAGVFSTKPIKPWDHAAGVLLHQEAGGYSALKGNELYVPYPVEGVLLLAPNKDRWEELIKFI